VTAKSKAPEEQLAAVRELAGRPPSEDVTVELRALLASRSNVVAAQACLLAASRGHKGLEPELIKVFDRLMQNPVKRDPSCQGKIAAVDALDSLGCHTSAVFVRGSRHVQLEPSFGPPIDTAADLRAKSVSALYRLGYPDIMLELVRLLVDPESNPYRAAIRILGALQQASSELLLRLTILQGVEEPELLGECFAALLSAAPGRSPAFVGRYVTSGDPLVAQEAAVALGNSRTETGFRMLRAFREDSVDPQFKEMLLLPLALTKCDEAFELLLGVVAEEHDAYAAAAIKALKAYAGSTKRTARIREAVAGRGDVRLIELCRTEIP
jgi:hypothetical protein